MQLSFEGWARNHGKKVMVNQRLAKDNIKKKAFPMQQNQFKVCRMTTDEDGTEGAKVLFSTSMRLGGDQMGELTLTTRDIVLLAKLCMADRTVSSIFEAYAEA